MLAFFCGYTATSNKRAIKPESTAPKWMVILWLIC